MATISEGNFACSKRSHKTTANDYEALVDNFGIRRTNPDFWQENDRMNFASKKLNPVEYGIFDLNRYENRWFDEIGVYDDVRLYKRVKSLFLKQLIA